MPTPEEQQVLRLLAKEWRHSGPPGIMDVSDIVAALGQAAVNLKNRSQVKRMTALLV